MAVLQTLIATCALMHACMMLFQIPSKSSITIIAPIIKWCYAELLKNTADCFLLTCYSDWAWAVLTSTFCNTLPLQVMFCWIIIAMHASMQYCCLLFAHLLYSDWAWAVLTSSFCNTLPLKVVFCWIAKHAILLFAFCSLAIVTEPELCLQAHFAPASDVLLN